MFTFWLSELSDIHVGFEEITYNPLNFNMFQPNLTLL